VKDKDDLDACVAALEAEDVRAEFDAGLPPLRAELDMLLPDPRALEYVDDARWLGKIRAAAAARYRDDKIDISDCGAKVRKLIEDAVVADGIEILVKQVSLFSPEFEEKLKALKSPEARASEMEHAIKDEIHVRLDEDPVFYPRCASGWSRSSRTTRPAASTPPSSSSSSRPARGAGGRPPRPQRDRDGDLRDAHEAEAPGRARTLRGRATTPVDPAKTELASLIEEQLVPQVNIVDWVHKDDVASGRCGG
jgi:type I restriction enzyme R subunit